MHHLKHSFPALLTCKLDKSKPFHFARADWAHLSSKHSTLFSLECKRMPLKFAFRAVCVCFILLQSSVTPPRAHSFWDSCREEHATAKPVSAPLFTTQTALLRWQESHLDFTFMEYSLKENTYLLHHIKHPNTYWFVTFF